jgi:hypothetical protein
MRTRSSWTWFVDGGGANYIALSGGNIDAGLKEYGDSGNDHLTFVGQVGYRWLRRFWE